MPGTPKLHSQHCLLTLTRLVISHGVARITLASITESSSGTVAPAAVRPTCCSIHDIHILTYSYPLLEFASQSLNMSNKIRTHTVSRFCLTDLFSLEYHKLGNSVKRLNNKQRKNYLKPRTSGAQQTSCCIGRFMVRAQLVHWNHLTTFLYIICINVFEEMSYYLHLYMVHMNLQDEMFSIFA